MESHFNIPSTLRPGVFDDSSDEVVPTPSAFFIPARYFKSTAHIEQIFGVHYAPTLRGAQPSYGTSSWWVVASWHRSCSVDVQARLRLRGMRSISPFDTAARFLVLKFIY